MQNQLLTILPKMDIDIESSNANKSNEQNVEDILIEQENDIALNDKKVNSIMSLLTSLKMIPQVYSGKTNKNRTIQYWIGISVSIVAYIIFVLFILMM